MDFQRSSLKLHIIRWWQGTLFNMRWGVFVSRQKQKNEKKKKNLFAQKKGNYHLLIFLINVTFIAHEPFTNWFSVVVFLRMNLTWRTCQKTELTSALNCLHLPFIETAWHRVPLGSTTYYCNRQFKICIVVKVYYSIEFIIVMIFLFQGDKKSQYLKWMYGLYIFVSHQYNIVLVYACFLENVLYVSLLSEIQLVYCKNVGVMVTRWRPSNYMQ